MKRNAFVLALCLSAVLPALAQLAPERLPAAVNVPAAAKSAIEVTLVQKKVLAGPKGAERLVDAGTVRPDDVIEYQATYTNTSAKPVTQVVARLPLPAGLAYVPRSARPAEGAALAAQDNQFGPEPLMRRLVTGKTEAVPYDEYRNVRWTLGQIPAGRSVTVSARARVEAVRPVTTAPAEPAPGRQTPAAPQP